MEVVDLMNIQTTFSVTTRSPSYLSRSFYEEGKVKIIQLNCMMKSGESLNDDDVAARKHCVATSRTQLLL